MLEGNKNLLKMPKRNTIGRSSCYSSSCCNWVCFLRSSWRDTVTWWVFQNAYHRAINWPHCRTDKHLCHADWWERAGNIHKWHGTVHWDTTLDRSILLPIISNVLADFIKVSSHSWYYGKKQILLKWVHFNNNDHMRAKDDPDYDPLFKVQPLWRTSRYNFLEQIREETHWGPNARNSWWIQSAHGWCWFITHVAVTLSQ